MLRKRTVALFLFSLLILLTGCETVKGTYNGASGGLKKDWEAARKTDDWMRKNLW